MPIEINGKIFYSPTEAAKKLKISSVMLRYYRLEGRIEGTDAGDGRHLYSEEQLAKADIDHRKRGPKGKKKGEDPVPLTVKRSSYPLARAV